MDLVSIVVTLLALALIGYLLHLIVTYVPMLEPFKQTIGVIAVVFLVLYLLAVVTGRATLLSLPG